MSDHVYVSPPWSDRDGEFGVYSYWIRVHADGCAGTPYTVCRIIEFLPPITTPRKGAASQRSANELQVKLSLYYRPSDVRSTSYRP